MLSENNYNSGIPNKNKFKPRSKGKTDNRSNRIFDIIKEQRRKYNNLIRNNKNVTCNEKQNNRFNNLNKNIASNKKQNNRFNNLNKNITSNKKQNNEFNKLNNLNRNNKTSYRNIVCNGRKNNKLN